jgi:hypothetical protein
MQFFSQKFNQLSPRLKILLSGIASIGILVAIITASFFDQPNNLRAKISSDTPQITSVTPLTGTANTEVHINGKNFGAAVAENVVGFGDYVAEIKTIGYAAGDTQTIVVAVPKLPSTGDYPITVTTIMGTAISAVNFSFEKASEISVPEILNFEPTSAAIGAEIYIFGKNFSSDPAKNLVKFNGIEASQVTIVFRDGEPVLKTIVPENAQTGHITFTVNNFTADSSYDFVVLEEDNSEQIYPSPKIISVSQTAVSPGDEIMMTGENLICEIDAKILFDQVPAIIKNFAKDADGFDIVLIEVPSQAQDSYLIFQCNDRTAISPELITVSGSTPLFDETRNFLDPEIIQQDTKIVSLYTFVSDSDGADDIVNVVADFSVFGGDSMQELFSAENEEKGKVFGLIDFEILTELPSNKTFSLPLTAIDKAGHRAYSEIIFQTAATESTESEFAESSEPFRQTQNLVNSNESNENNISSNYSPNSITELNQPNSNQITQHSAAPTTPNQNYTNLPPAPFKLIAKTETNGIRLTWTPANNEAQTYRIYYSTVSGSFVHRVEAGSGTEFFLMKNLKNNQQYFFAATAVDTNGVESLPSNEASAIFLFTPEKVSTQPVPVVNLNSPAVISVQSSFSESAHSAALPSLTKNKPPSLSEQGPAGVFWIGFGAVVFGWLVRCSYFCLSDN